MSCIPRSVKYDRGGDKYPYSYDCTVRNLSRMHRKKCNEWESLLIAVGLMLGNQLHVFLGRKKDPHMGNSRAVQSRSSSAPQVLYQHLLYVFPYDLEKLNHT